MVEGEESRRVGGAHRRYSPHVTNVARPPHTLMKPRASLRARAMKLVAMQEGDWGLNARRRQASVGRVVGREEEGKRQADNISGRTPRTYISLSRGRVQVTGPRVQYE